MKARDLAPKYVTTDKVSGYIKKLLEKGLWSWDEDWPGDEEDWGVKQRLVVLYYKILYMFSLGSCRFETKSCPLKEIWYYPATGKKFVRRDITSEKMSLRGETKGPDSELLDSLTGNDGVLQAGCMPALDMGNENGI